ncbi:MAG: molybdopterin-binding protein, partial [Chloroflexota bacterium]|nr:molybdopterin-binding protein [Chloroflexota bacterium]
DTNSAYLGDQLPRIGIRLKKLVSIGDNLREIRETLESELVTADIVFTTGGMGPTSDDLTREAIAEFCGEKLSIDSDQLSILKSTFKARHQVMPDTNLKQASLIPSASAIPNPNGTAPGWFVENRGKIIVALPGPPVELQHMWRHDVSSRLEEMSSDAAYISKNIKTFGISEGELDQIFSHLFGKENPFLGIYSKQDGIHLRIIAKASNKEIAKKLIEPLEVEICDKLGNSVWGFDDDTPAQLLIDELRKQGKSISVKEGFTKGLICSNLSEAAGNNYVPIKGLITSPTMPKEERFPTSQSKDVLILSVSDTIQSEGKGKITIEASCDSKTNVISLAHRNNSLRVRQRTANQAILGALRLLNDLR